MTLGSINVVLGMKDRNLGRGLDQAKRKVSGFAGSFKSQMAAAASASRMLAAGVAITGAAVGGLAARGVQLAGRLEQVQIAFETMLGSGEEARAFLDNLQQFAASTPFQFQGLASASQKMLAFGFEARNVMGILQAVGNAVAALGGGQAEMNGVVMALGQMQAKGKASAEELRQLAERGIPAYDILAKRLDMTGEQVQDIGNQGVSASRAIQALAEGMQERFGGAMEKQSKTLIGLFSTLRDNLSFILAGFGDFTADVLGLKEGMAALNGVLSSFRSVVMEKGFGQAIASLIPDGLKNNIVGVAGALTGALIPALWATAKAVWVNMAPLVAWAAAGYAIAKTAYTIYDNWSGIVSFFSRLASGLANVASGISDTVVGYLKGMWPTAQAAFLRGISNLIGPLKRFASWLGAEGLAGDIAGFQSQLDGMADATAQSASKAGAQVARGMAAISTEFNAAASSIGRGAGRLANSALGIFSGDAIAGMISKAKSVGQSVGQAFGLDLVKGASDAAGGGGAGLDAPNAAAQSMTPAGLDALKVEGELKMNIERVASMGREQMADLALTTKAALRGVQDAVYGLSRSIGHMFAETTTALAGVLTGFSSWEDAFASIADAAKGMMHSMLRVIQRVIEKIIAAIAETLIWRGLLAAFGGGGGLVGSVITAGAASAGISPSMATAPGAVPQGRPSTGTLQVTTGTMRVEHDAILASVRAGLAAEAERGEGDGTL